MADRVNPLGSREKNFMGNDFEEHALEFHALDGMTFDDINFSVLETDTVGPVESEYDEVFERERYNVLDVLIPSLKDLLQAHQLTLGTLIVVTQLQDESVNCLGFLYRDDFRIVPIRFESSPHFDAWFKGIASGFQREEVVHQITSTGLRGWSSSKRGVYEQTEAFLKTNAPKEYHRAA